MDSGPTTPTDQRGFWRRNAKRIGVAVAGFVLVLAGGLMLVTPGPGWLAIFAGLAILATEFAWAERALHRVKERGKAAVDLATASRLRLIFSVLLTLGGIVAAIWAWLYFT